MELDKFSMSRGQMLQLMSKQEINLGLIAMFGEYSSTMGEVKAILHKDSRLPITLLEASTLANKSYNNSLHSSPELSKLKLVGL